MNQIIELLEKSDIPVTDENIFALSLLDTDIILKEINTNTIHHDPNLRVDVVKNYSDDDIFRTSEASLRNEIIRIQADVSGRAINTVQTTNNQYSEDMALISEDDESEILNMLALALIGYYGVILPLFGGRIMNKRVSNYGLMGSFRIDSKAREYIENIAQQTSKTHLNTILGDLTDTILETYENEITRHISVIESTGRKASDADLVKARQLAMEGKSRDQITKAIREEYNGHISKARAKAISTTETNRAFTQSQFIADRQFLEQNGLTKRAYKKWVTTNDNPCPTCLDLASKPPIPFEKNFAELGDEIVTVYEENDKRKVKRLTVDFEPLSAGNAHVNCGCKYELIIK